MRAPRAGRGLACVSVPDPPEDELAAAERELREHRASWSYAMAMGSSAHGASEHPVHWLTRHRTTELEARVAELRARRDAGGRAG